jgi:hypothetical protein
MESYDWLDEICELGFWLIADWGLRNTAIKLLLVGAFLLILYPYLAR